MKHLTEILIFLVFWTHFSFAEDSDTLLVLSGESLGGYWEIEKIKRPYYPRVAALNGVEGCAAIAFIIESNGSTSSYRPLAGYPSEVFLGPAMDAIKKWKFRPSKTNVLKQPVYTFQIVEFSLGSGSHDDFVENKIIGNTCSEEANKILQKYTSDAGTG